MFPLVQYISNFYDDQSDKSKIFASEKLIFITIIFDKQALLNEVDYWFGEKVTFLP